MSIEEYDAIQDYICSLMADEEYYFKEEEEYYEGMYDNIPYYDGISWQES